MGGEYDLLKGEEEAALCLRFSPSWPFGRVVDWKVQSSDIEKPVKVQPSQCKFTRRLTGIAAPYFRLEKSLR